MITCIRRADWVVAWDGGRHVYRRHVDLAFGDGTGDRAGDADRIVHLGPDYTGPADREIDGTDRLLLPGLVNVHSHPSSEPINKGYREEFGNPLLYWSPLYDRAGLLRTGDDEARLAATELALGEMLTSGVTSVCDLAAPWSGWLDTLAGSGMRAWAVPGFASARWVPRTSADAASVGIVHAHDVDYEWDEAGGHRALAAAVDAAEEADRHPSGRLAGMLSPAQVDTCSAELIRAAVDTADAHGWRIQIHAAQSLFEFQEMTRRNGCTPIQWLDRIGALRPTTTIAHGIFLDRHSWTRWPTDLDLDLLASTGTGLAHCPVVFSRHGQAAEDIGGYLRSGITVGVGTDSFPHNLLEELRMAATLGWSTTGDVRSITTAELFTAATVGGAALVGRNDLGRLAVGAAADVVSVDLTTPAMQPVRDPLRSLIYTAADRAVADVFVAGRPVVVDGRVITIDVDDAGRRLDEARRRAEATASDRHHLGRPAVDLSPLTLPVGDGPSST
ncbi:MAG: amidohydrolase family protein [Actinomycetota bacterium]